MATNTCGVIWVSSLLHCILSHGWSHFGFSPAYLLHSSRRHFVHQYWYLVAIQPGVLTAGIDVLQQSIDEHWLMVGSETQGKHGYPALIEGAWLILVFTFGNNLQKIAKGDV
jgi:hypothetical protein